MALIKASVYDGDELVATDVEVEVQIEVARSGIKRWFGIIFHPLALSEYRIVATDGREGKAMITEIGIDYGGMARFCGTGPFEVPK